MDLSSEDFYNNSYWDKSKSWVNKNKFKPKWLFRTLLVFATDGWHLLQFFFLNLLIVSVVLYKPLISIWWDLLIFSIAGRLLFELIYSIIKKTFMKTLKQIVSSPLVWAFLSAAGLVPLLQAIFGHPYGVIGFAGIPLTLGITYLVQKFRKKK